MARWATFDCYGTLIDWNAGIGGVLERLFGAERAPTLLAPLPRARAGGAGARRTAPTREVLSLTLERLASRGGYGIPEGESGALAQLAARTGRRSRRCRRRSRSCAAAAGASRSSRTSDRDLIAASQRRLGVPFDLTIVAEDVALVQARARPLGALLRADDGATASSTCTSPRASSTTSRRRSELGLPVGLDQPARRARAEPGARPRAARPRRLPDTLDELVPA